MLRGYVENVSDSTVSGWFYSEETSLKGRTVLAFVDNDCVGAGQIELFRQDLLDAGLGDGFLGFSFFVSVSDEADYDRLVVRLDGSDAILLQSKSMVTARSPKAQKVSPEDVRQQQERLLTSLRWMRRQGWLNQSDFDFLRFFRQFGVYDRTLTVQVQGTDKTETQMRDPAEVARELLLLYRMSDVDIEQLPIASLADLKDLFLQHSEDKDEFVVALWSAQRGRLKLIEGSHTQQPTHLLAAMPSSDYALSPDRLLFINGKCALDHDCLMPADGITAYFTKPLRN